MAQTHLADVLKASGLPEDQVKALTDLPEDTKDFKTDTYIAPIRSNVETQVKNDPKFYEGLNKENLPKEFLKTLESEQYGRSAAQVRANMLKAVGLSDKDFADLGDDGKKIDVFTPAFVKKLSEGKVGDKELQAKLIEANKKLEEIETSIPEIEKKYKGEYDGKITDFQVSNGIFSLLAAVPGLSAPAKNLAPDITAQLRAKFAFAIVDNTIELRQKSKPDLKAMNEKGTAEVTLKDAIQQIVEADGLVDKKKITTTTTTTKIDTGPEGLNIGKHVSDKANKRKLEDAKAG